MSVVNEADRGRSNYAGKRAFETSILVSAKLRSKFIRYCLCPCNTSSLSGRQLADMSLIAEALACNI
jgi:hypothetical protein